MSDDRDNSGDHEGGKRLRAAFAYAGLSKKARAEALGVGERQVSRYESGQTPVPTQRLEAVASATGVPSWFFKTGFAVAPEPEEPAVAERVEALEHRLEALADTTRADALKLLRQALEDLYPGRSPAPGEAPSRDADEGRPDRSAGGAGT